MVQESLASMGTPSNYYLQELGMDPANSMYTYRVEDVKETIDGTPYAGSAAYATIPESDAESALEEIMGDDVTVTVTRSGVLLKTVIVDIVNNSSTANTNVSKYTGGAGAGMMGIADDFVIRVPYYVVSTNGEKKSKNFREVTFDLMQFDSDQVSEVHMEVTYLNLFPIILFGGIGLACIIAMIVILIVVNKKRKKEMETTPLVL